MSPPAQLTAAGLIALTLCGLASCLPAPANAGETTAAMSVSMKPDRLRAKASLTITLRYAAAHGLPEPLRRAVVLMPEGVTLSIPLLRSCGVRRLRAQGPKGCPAPSRIGEGVAHAQVHVGSQTLSEKVGLSIFLGPLLENPTFAILATGYTPLEKRLAIAGVVLPASSPYEEKLVMSVPPISTLPLQPDASITSLSLTVGSATGRPSSVLVPSRCPEGGFPFMARFTYADGTTGEAHAVVECPITKG